MTTIPDPQIYHSAIGVIRRAGWTQGDFVNEMGECCAAGAIRWGTNSDPVMASDATNVAEMWLAGQVLGAEYVEKFKDVSPGGFYVAVGSWNDAPGRTEAEVVAALEAAASAAESARAAAETGGAK